MSGNMKEMFAEPIIERSEVGHETKLWNGSFVRDCSIGNKCVVGDFSRIYGCNICDCVRIERNNHIVNSSIGRYSYTGSGTVIHHAQIGAFSSISWGITIGGAEHDWEKITTHSFLFSKTNIINPNGEIGYNRFTKPLNVGNDVWIGANSTIARGVNVGDGAVIGSNSFVNKNIPPYAIVAGSPASVKKYRFPENVVERLLKILWWQLPAETIAIHFDLFNSPMSECILSQLEEIRKTSTE
jgi:virginiamycin A acetyltransferase